ncbi:MAG: hypothetical protein DSY55_03430 [Clostridia bacterium]|nr:MAG: hypothetical protein DSY55_03430 [Clostridia bacterium]
MFYAILKAMFRHFLAGLLLFLLSACVAPPVATPIPPSTPTAISIPLATFTPTPAPPITTLTATPRPTATPTPIVQFWQPLFPGAEVAQTDDGLTMLRHAASLVRYNAWFENDPEKVQLVSDFLLQSDQARAAINCGFYWDNDGAFVHMGLLAVMDKQWAPVRANWGAAFIVREGNASLVRHPSKKQPPMTFGIQGWPTLLWQGRIIKDLDDVDVARRTAVGIDASGRVVWVVDPAGSTLQAFAKRLLQEDVGLVNAVNLDGGSSTGLMWRQMPDEEPQGVDSFPIPCAVMLAPLK